MRLTASPSMRPATRPVICGNEIRGETVVRAGRETGSKTGGKTVDKTGCKTGGETDDKAGTEISDETEDETIDENVDVIEVCNRTGDKIDEEPSSGANKQIDEESDVDVGS